MYKLEDINNLDLSTIKNLYTDHVNASQVKLFKPFKFSEDLADFAEGCWIYTKSKKKILDATGGIGVLNHGHNHPRILAARKKFQDLKKMEVHKNFFSPYIAALSHNIAEMLPSGLSYSYFANSGAEAVEGAVKLAYKYHKGKRNIILHSDISFHGKLLGAGSLTNSPEVYFKFPRINNTDSFKFNSISSIEKKVAKYRNDIFAIIIEPLNASSMTFSDVEFLQKLRVICDQFNIVLIFDEVYTGWGKTGNLFNFMRCDNLIPDILVYAKSFGGGKASISGYSYSKKLAESYNNIKDVTLHSTTYYGFGEECITAIEALNIIQDEELIKNSKKIEQHLSRTFSNLHKTNLIKTINGSGALWGIVFEDNFFVDVIKKVSNLKIGKKELFDSTFLSKVIPASYVNYLYSKENVLTYFGSNYINPLIISLPLVAGDEELNYLAAALERTFNKNPSQILFDFIKNNLI